MHRITPLKRPILMTLPVAGGFLFSSAYMTRAKAAVFASMSTDTRSSAFSLVPYTGLPSWFQAPFGTTFLPVTEKSAASRMTHFIVNTGLLLGERNGADDSFAADMMELPHAIAMIGTNSKILQEIQQ